MSDSQVMERGPAVLWLDPGDEVVDSGALANLNFTVIQPKVTADIGPCALEGCDGLIRQVTVPIQDPVSHERSLHRVNVCTRPSCGSRFARGNGAARRQIVTEQIGWLKQEGMPESDIRRLHGEDSL